MLEVKNLHYTRILGVAALAVTLSSGMPLTASAQSRARTVSLDAGTVIPVRLNDTLSSKDSQKGDTFTATVKTNDKNNDGYADYNSLPDGTKIEGVVRSAREKQDKDPGVLDIEFRRVRLPNGRSYAISGSLIGLDSKSVTRTKDGRLVAKPGHKTDRLTYVGYGAGAGLIIGLLTKKPLEDTLIGGGLGYLFGALEKSNNSPKDVVLKPGTEMGVRLDRSLSLSGYGSSSNDNRDDTNFYRRQRDNNSNDNSNRNDRSSDTASDSQDNPTDIGVLVNDKDVRFDSTVRPIETKGTVLVPVAPVLSAANVSYRYDRDRKELRVSSDQGVVRIGAGSRIATINGNRRVRLPAAAQYLNGALYVPIRFLEVATGGTVSWDASSRTVVLTQDNR